MSNAPVNNGRRRFLTAATSVVVSVYIFRHFIVEAKNHSADHFQYYSDAF